VRIITGIGYHMRIVKSNTCDVSKVTSVIHSYVPLARLENNVSTELTYELPRDSVDQFATMFAALERDKKVLGITSFGASLTTLEEVFLKLVRLVLPSDA
jgi:ATP-binding cassette subfamily A (ABC1) protein 3